VNTRRATATTTTNTATTIASSHIQFASDYFEPEDSAAVDVYSKSAMLVVTLAVLAGLLVCAGEL